MTNYWCVNLDSEDCLKHGIERNLWMMQYQYEDDHGNVFQGGKQKSATTTNWKRLKKINAGDWFVAYLPRNRTVAGNTFFAIGQARTPRRPPTSNDHKSTIDDYVKDQRSHDHKKGYLYYEDAPVFYEDFTDKWRPDDKTMKCAQRIDVEKWQYYISGGVPWLSDLKIPAPEIQRAFFTIPKVFFDRIAKNLAGNHKSRPNEQADGEVDEVTDDAVVEALEKHHAKSQGFQLDSKLRKALENYAMDAATQHFRSLGYIVDDHSKNHPYDLRCSGRKGILYVEVKGTQTNGKGIFLTSGEVGFSHQHKGQMALFLLHSINVSKDKKVLSNGEKHIVEPWSVDERYLKPMSYQYELPSRL